MLFLTGLMILLLGLNENLKAQCTYIDQVGFTPDDTVHCGFPLSIDFQPQVSVDSTPVLLSMQQSSANFKSNFSFSFPTANNGCYYYLEISGSYTLWSNSNHYFDAISRFNINSNNLISMGGSNNLSITSPLFIEPNTYSTSHVYRYYYQGNGSNITVSFSDNQASDNTGSMSFSWHVVPCFSTFWDLGDGTTSGETAVSHTYTNPGAYPVTLTVTSELDGCSETFSGLVNVLPLVETNLSATICQGESFALGNEIFTETGTYAVVFDSYTGCDSTVTLNLLTLDPQASILPPNAMDCIHPTVVLDGSGSSGGPGVSYLWTGPAPGCIVGNASQATLTASCAGLYSLLVTQTAADGTQCSASAQVAVQADLEPPLVELEESAEFPCEASELALTAVVTSGGANLSYSWQTATGSILSGGNTPTALIDAPGIYQLTATNLQNGCTGSDEITVTGAPQMLISWEATAPDCLNPGGSISIQVDEGGKAPFLYSIDGGSSFQQLSAFGGLEAGSYQVLVQDASGCETEAQLVTLEAIVPITVETVPELSIFAGESQQLDAWVNLPSWQIDSILWMPSESLSCANCLDPVASPVASTEYLIEVWDVKGCRASAAVKVIVVRSAVYAPNIFSPNGDGINDAFMLYSRQGSVAVVRSFTVFSKWGQVLFQQTDFHPNDPQYGWDGDARGRKMDPGVYAWLAEVEYADGTVEVLKGGVVLAR